MKNFIYSDNVSGDIYRIIADDEKSAYVQAMRHLFEDNPENMEIIADHMDFKITQVDNLPLL